MLSHFAGLHFHFVQMQGTGLEPVNPLRDYPLKVASLTASLPLRNARVLRGLFKSHCFQLSLYQ